MKKQSNMSPPEVNNSTIRDLNDSEMDEILNNKLKRTMLRMTNEIKEHMLRMINEIKEHVCKHLD
jgi:hypothetical protein